MTYEAINHNWLFGPSIPCWVLSYGLRITGGVPEYLKDLRATNTLAGRHSLMKCASRGKIRSDLHTVKDWQPIFRQGCLRC